jgi:hypothetical protein
LTPQWLVPATDTPENEKIRGEAAKALIAEERDRLNRLNRLKSAQSATKVDADYLERRKVTVSVPSFLGNAISRIWGRHTMYELDLSDKKAEIAKAFMDSYKGIKLSPFPQKKPSLATRLKKNIFFSAPMIRFLRRHMMGRVDEIHLKTQDIFNHLKSTKGEKLNYVLLDDKMVLAKVHANGGSKESIKRVSDWALSKHALLANRQEVYCSGEIWYDSNTNRFMMNDDSGTYVPDAGRVAVVAQLANKIFKASEFGYNFEVANLAAAEVA